MSIVFKIDAAVVYFAEVNGECGSRRNDTSSLRILAVGQILFGLNLFTGREFVRDFNIVNVHNQRVSAIAYLSRVSDLISK